MNSLLNAHREFFWPMAGPIFNNLVVIVTMFSYPFISAQNAQLASVWLAVGTTLGVAVMFAVQIPALLRLKVPLRFQIRLNDSALGESLKMALPVTIFVMINLVVTSVLNAVSLRIADSGPATIQYAWLWYQLPYGVIAVALSTALFTEMAEASASSNMQKLRANINFGLRTTLFAIIPLAVAIFVLSDSLASLYHAGQFSSDDVAMVAEVLRAWCLAIPFFAAYRFMYRAFSSLKDLKLFIMVDACGRVVQVVLYLVLSSGFGNWSGLGLVGLPLADAIAHFLLTSAMLIVLRTQIGSYGLKGIVFDGLKMIIAAIIAAVPVITWRTFFPGLEAQSISSALLTVVVWGLFILLIYYLASRFLKIPETSAVDRVLSRFRRKR
jgi:putative peptidoglycan lipid II flippase